MAIRRIAGWGLNRGALQRSAFHARRSVVTALVVIAALGCRTGIAVGHPHVWIDVTLTLLFDEQHVRAVRVEWLMDEFVSASLQQTFDVNKNRILDPPEIRKLQEQVFANTREAQFYLHLRTGKTATARKAPADFTANLNKKRIAFPFTVPLAAPANPAAAPLHISVYDPSYYVDVAFADNTPIRLVGPPPEACQTTLGEDRANPIYFGMVYPPLATVRCRPF